MSDLKAIHDDGPKLNTVDRVQLSLKEVGGTFSKGGRDLLKKLVISLFTIVRQKKNVRIWSSLQSFIFHNQKTRR